MPWPVIKNYFDRKNTKFRSRTQLLRKGMLKGYRNERYFGESSTFYTNGRYNIQKDTLEKNHIDIASIRILYIMKKSDR